MSYERSSITELASELGILPDRIYSWRKEFADYGSASFSGHGVERLSDEGKQLKETQKKLRNAEMELEILKKAIAVFSKIDRQFEVDSPGKVWVSDITYIGTQEGFIYLTSVIDLFDRKVVGWSLSDNMTAKDTAVRNRKTVNGMVFHSDRGVQYASEEFRSEIKGKVVQSMSRRENCCDNAVAESFFRPLKCEMIYGNKTLSAEQMELEFFEYIEIWYNKARRHSALKNMTIDEFWSANKKSA